MSFLSSTGLMSDVSSSSSTGKSQQEELLSMFRYDPSIAAAYIFCILFFLVSFPIAWITLKTGKRFMWIIVVTAWAEGVGYALRLAVIDKITLSGYVLMTLFVLLAPNALALVDYNVLGKIAKIQAAASNAHINNAAAAKSGCRLPILMDAQGTIIGSRVASFFFLSDVISFLLQAMGGGMMSGGTADSVKNGESVMMIGLAIQLAFFAAFTFLCVHVWRLHQNMKARSEWIKLPNGSTYDLNKLDRVFHALAATIVLLTVRNVFRFAEFAEGHHGTLATSEAFYYCLDALLMFGCFIVYLVWHFGFFLPTDDVIVTSPTGEFNLISQDVPHMIKAKPSYSPSITPESDSTYESRV